MNTTHFDTDVLIVGAGPTGLSLAAALQKLGIRHRLIEQKPSLSETYKATNLMQGTQEQLAGYDLLGEMYEASGKMRRIVMHGYGANLSPVSMHLPESVFPDILLYGQDRIEASLAQTIQQRGGAISFSTSLKHLVQTAEGATATVEKDGVAETILARYVVGCDGPRSVTRTFTTCDFTPVKTGCAIRQVDARLHWKRLGSMEQMWLFYLNDGFVVVVPLLDGYTRILSIEPKVNMPARNPTLEELRDKLRTTTGDDSVELTDPKWFSYTELSMGIAPRLGDGRVLLAGDAGNPILPNGGQGLNTGIQDSLNVAWKLAAVINKQAPDNLLDTYEAERLTLRQGLEKIQYNSLKYTTQTSAPARWLIRTFGGWLLKKAGGEYQMAKAFSQLNVNYRKSPLTVETMKGGLVQAGDRPPNAEIISANTFQEVRLFDLLAAPHWKLLIFNQSDDDISQLQTNFQQLAGQFGIEPIIISTTAQTPADTRFLYYDTDEIAHLAFGIKKPTLLLIRPDRYVAVRTLKSDQQVLNNVVNQWFIKSVSPVNSLQTYV